MAAFLSHATPESQGIASSAILRFVEEAERNIHELHSFVLVRHGQVVAQGGWAPYAPERPHMLFSLTKSFTSTATGLAIAEGRLSLEDHVISFFPDDLPAEISPNLAAMKVRHLLSMSTGHIKDTTEGMFQDPDGNLPRGFLAQPVEHEPGAPFVYNSGASHMLSAIVQKVTGLSLKEYLTPRLFQPLGIRDPFWETDPRGICIGGWGLSISSEQIARFGQLYLQKGVWNGQQLLPQDWVEQATRKQVENGSDETSDWAQGYGFQFWRCRHNSYRGDGAFGQFCIVMPDQDAVLAITSGVDDMQEVLNHVWDNLLPALSSPALPGNLEAHAALTSKLSALSIQAPAGETNSPLEAELSGRRYFIEPNPAGARWAWFRFTPSETVFRLKDQRGTHEVRLGRGTWYCSTASLHSPENRKLRAAASGVWAGEDTFVMTLRYDETPFFFTITCIFADDELAISMLANVAFGPLESPVLTGRLRKVRAPTK